MYGGALIPIGMFRLVAGESLVLDRARRYSSSASVEYAGGGLLGMLGPRRLNCQYKDLWT